MDSEKTFKEFSHLLETLEATTKRNEKKSLISSFLRELSEEEIQPTISFLIGRIFSEADSRVLEIGGKTLFKILRDVKQATLFRESLTILKVCEYFREISKLKGKGSRQKKENLIKSLFQQASELERIYLIRLLVGEMRIGVVEGVTLEAIADAADVDLSLVRRANMLLGNLGEVAHRALMEGKKGLMRVNVNLFTPIKPMLAEMSYDFEEIFASHNKKTAFEFKFDGARVQIHVKKDKVKVFSRRLMDVTKSVPEIVQVVNKHINVVEALLEGEVVAYGENDKPLPFQDLMRRFRRVHQIDVMTQKIPLKLYLFDLLYLNGELLIDYPYSKRWNLLSKICDSTLLTERIVTEDIITAQKFLASAMNHGHEGLMAKALNSTYVPGTRGKKWFKIKPVETLDLVIIAADWGYGRRKEWLSNYHLTARSEETDEYLQVGKTFKGLTDEEFRRMTHLLQGIQITENKHTIYVEPRIVVEVAFNEIQRSSQYKSGFALRFARITKIRTDKNPEDADSIERIRRLYKQQFKFKAQLQFDDVK